MHRSLIIPAILFALVACGCSSSLVYSSSVMLPSKPLVKEQGQLTMGVEMLPETRPQAADRYAVVGGAATIRYAFSSRLTLGGKIWNDLTDGGFRGGLSAEGIVMIGIDSTSLRWGLMPRSAMLIDDGSIDGGGAALAAVVWFPWTSLITPYVAIGPALGFRDISTTEPQWGYGLIGNLGAAFTPVAGLQVALEVAGIGQINVYDGIRSGVLAPGMSISWMF